MKKIIGKLLIVLGIVLICTVVYINYRTIKINEEFINEYKQSTQSLAGIKYKYKAGDIIAILEIPKINLEVAVKRGITEDILKDAVGHFENTPMPYENGNFSIAGHSAYISNKFFSKLDKVSIGDEIIVLCENKKYRYKVNSIDIVTPDKVDVISSENIDKKEITLVTCTPKYVGSHRLIIKGVNIE